jgi:creatine kinase/arginine kinase
MDGLPALNKKIAEKVVSSRVRVARSLSNYPFESSMNVKQRLKLEKDVLQAINSTLKDTEFGGGKYYSLSKLSQAEKTDLVSRHLLFKEGDKYLQSAGITADWPEGRGAYVSKDERFIIWINEEDHLRIMYMDKGADIATVADKLFTAINSLGRKLKFARSNKFGYLNSCPTNIGSAMRASILVKVADKSEDELKHASKQQGLSVRGTGGEHTAVVGSTYDISYKKRLGDSERKLIKDFIDKVNLVLD